MCCACFQVATQASETGAIADEDEWPIQVITKAEVFMRSQAQVYGVSDRCLLGQPARRDAEAAVFALLLSYQQVYTCLLYTSDAADE